MFDKHRMTMVSAALMLIMGTSAQAAPLIVDAYEDVGFGGTGPEPTFPHSMDYSTSGATANTTIGTIGFPNIWPLSSVYEINGDAIAAGTITINQTVTNNSDSVTAGWPNWSGWQVAVWESSDWNARPLINPGNVGIVSATASGGTTTIYNSLGVVDVNFASPVTGGDTFTLSITLDVSGMTAIPNFFLDGSSGAVVQTAMVPQPVPVPAALPLMLSGLAGLAGIAARRKHH